MSFLVRAWPIRQADEEGNPTIVGAPLTLRGVHEGGEDVITVHGFRLAITAGLGTGDTYYAGDYIGAPGVELSNAVVNELRTALL